MISFIPRLRIVGTFAACMVAAQGSSATSTCGMPDPQPASPSDLENVQGDLSLAHWAQQPVGPVTCSYGYFAAKCGDFATAHRIFDKCIAKGYAGAMIWKGLLLEDGSGVARDPVQAAALYKQAADSGNEQYATLGKLHYASALYEGNGVAKNEALARQWFQKAAAEGSQDAEEFLRTGHHTGSRNQRGEGVGPTGPTGQIATGQALALQAIDKLPELPGLPAMLGLLMLGLTAGGAGLQWRRQRYSKPGAQAA